MERLTKVLNFDFRPKFNLNSV